MAATVVLLLLAALLQSSVCFRILESGAKTPNGTYFAPYAKGFVGVYGDPNNYQRERINEGAYETSEQELLFEGVSPRQSCPGMVGPFSDGSYYCSAREYGYCDRRSGTCFCNTGYQGIDCTVCQDTHFQLGSLCFPKKLCVNDCSGAGTCDYRNGTCSCLPNRIGVQCETLLCSIHDPQCELCTEEECLQCAAGYYLTGSSPVCGSCNEFDPRCTGCTLDDGCTVCADSTLTSIRRSGYRLSDPPLPPEENLREFGITLPFGTKSPESFADAEYYYVCSTAAHPLRNSTISCVQGLSDDASWSCKPYITSQKVCGHSGVFSFIYPNYVIAETANSIRMSVLRTGGGFGPVTISYFIRHITTNDSDLIATAHYTTSQTLFFQPGMVELSFLITILDDSIVEGDEVFQVVLEIPQGNSNGASLGTQFRTNVTIIDNDATLLSHKLSRCNDTTLQVVAGKSFSTSILAMGNDGQPMTIVGGERFFAVIENNERLWIHPGTASGSQRNALRQVCTVSGSNHSASSYTVSSTGIVEQGNYQLRVYYAFPNAIRGDYFYDGFFDRLAMSRFDHNVNYTWGTGRLIPSGTDYVTVRWSGAILSGSTSGNYSFKVDADDHARLWIDGRLLMDHWHMGDVNLLEVPKVIYLAANTLYELVLEYREVQDSAHARLLWSLPGSATLQVVPQTSLYSLLEISQSPVIITIQSAVTAASTTECHGEGLYSGTALHTSYFTICPRDVYGNMRDDDDDLFYLSTDIFFANLTLINNHAHQGVGPETIVPDIWFNPNTYCFDASYTPQRSGNYELSIFHEASRGSQGNKAHVSGSPFYLTVIPDTMSGPLSVIDNLVSQQPLYMVAGFCSNFTVVARDNAENLLLKGGNHIQAYMYRVNYYSESDGLSIPTTSTPTIHPTFSPTFRPTTSSNVGGISVLPSDAIVPEVVRDGLVFDHSNGNYTVQLCPVIAGIYEIHVLLGGKGVSNQPFHIINELASLQLPMGRGSYYGQYVAGSPYTLVVSHTVGSTATTTAVGAGLLTATANVPASFMITVRDPYDNVLRTSTTVVTTITAKLDRSPNATVSIWDYQNGSYNVEYIPILAGENLVSVYLNGYQIRSSPFKVSVLAGATSARYSFAVGAGLHSGRTGVPSYFEVYSFDIDGNRKTNNADVYTFVVNGTNSITGKLLPCLSTTIVEQSDDSDRYICNGGGYDGDNHVFNGRYYGVFTPLNTGLITISVYLETNHTISSGSKVFTLAQLYNSPFNAIIVPSRPKAEYSNVTGTLYNNIAGVTATVAVQLRDYYGNKLQTGGRSLKLALLRMADDDSDGDDIEYTASNTAATVVVRDSSLTDLQDGRYLMTYNAPITGQYQMHLSLAEDGLNATYYNSTSFGSLHNSNSSLIYGLSNVNGDFGRQDMLYNKYLSRSEFTINLDLRSGDMDAYIGNSIVTPSTTTTTASDESGFYKFRDEFWSASWTGMIRPEYAEEYIFTAVIDDDSTAVVWIGDQCSLTYCTDDNSANQDGVSSSVRGTFVLNITTAKALPGRLNFTNTHYRDIVVHYAHFTGNAVLKLYWESPSTARSLIPATAFSHWRNISFYNTTIHPASLCSHCSTAHGVALHTAQVAVKKSFLVHARDQFGNLLRTGGDSPTMVAIGRGGVVAFRGMVTDYGNSTYLIEYYPTQAGNYNMYVTMGCCAPDPAIGMPAELQQMKALLVHGAPFALIVTSAPVDPSRTIAVGSGLTGSTVGQMNSFTVFYRDIYNNPTTVCLVEQKPALTVKFVDQVSGSEINPITINMNYITSNSSDNCSGSATTEYNITRAGKYLMYVYLSTISSTLNYASGIRSSTPVTKAIVGSPYQITLSPEQALPSLTVCRGLGLRQATATTNLSAVAATSAASFEIQLYDRFNNHLIVGGDKFYIRLVGAAAFQIASMPVVPMCRDTQNGRYICSYTTTTTMTPPGTYKLEIKLLSNSVKHPGGQGLTGSYYTTSDGAIASLSVDDAAYTRTDSTVSFYWANGYIIPTGTDATTIPLHTAAGQSVRWDGYLCSPRTDVFRITVDSLNMATVSVYIDDVLVFDDSYHMHIRQDVSFIAESTYRIRVIAVVAPASSASTTTTNPAVSIDLHWSTATIKEYTIPQFFLYDNSVTTQIAMSPFPVIVSTA